MTEKLAYSYIRMSTEIQLRGDSLRRQSEASAIYAQQNGLKLVPENELKDIQANMPTPNHKKTPTCKKSEEVEEQRAALEAEQDFDPFAGGFPVPPMPGQIAQPSRHAKVTISSGVASSQAATETTEGTNV